MADHDKPSGPSVKYEGDGESFSYDESSVSYAADDGTGFKYDKPAKMRETTIGEDILSPFGDDPVPDN